MNKLFLFLAFFFAASAHAQYRSPQGNCSASEKTEFAAQLGDGPRLYSCDRVEGLMRTPSGALEPGYVVIVINSPMGGQLGSDPRGITVHFKRVNKTNRFTLDDLGTRLLGFRYQASPTGAIQQKEYVIDDVNGDGFLDVVLASNSPSAGLSELYVLSVIWTDRELELKELVPYLQYQDGLRAENNNNGTFIIANDSPTAALVKKTGEVSVLRANYQWDPREGKYVRGQDRAPQSTAKKKKKK